MQPAIPLGTLLQKRYRVTKILGQGGFGRTYLAQDTACFDELCVLKEFTPNERGRDSLKKARELFGREAKTLHRISHPQIPSFRANFEEAKRLFLVQEYAEGKTYAKILGERIRESKTFTEEEALTFLQQMLPILTNIHSQGIIHRDISPDNIILREVDQLPVLIDFGVVKAGVQNLEAAGAEFGQQGTTVGKAGYAPNEQLQTGEAYANSDLYALAVTVVVLMTGRKPESLIDKSTMTWKWQQLLPTISPWFAKVLMRMMSYRPNNRYQSATEVSQALRAVEDVVGSSSGFAAGNIGPSTGSRVNSNVSVPSAGNNKYITYAPKYQQRSQLWTNPWVLSAAGGVVIIIPFMLFKLLFSGEGKTPPPPKPITSGLVNPASPNPNAAPLSVNPESPAPAVPVSSPSPSVAVLPEIVSLLPWQPALVKEGTIKENQTVVYQLSLQQGQKLSARLEGDAQMSILAATKDPIDFRARKINQWQGDIPTSGDYYVEVSTPAGVSNGNYKLTLSNNLPSPSPVSSPGAVSPLPVSLSDQPTAAGNSPLARP